MEEMEITLKSVGREGLEGVRYMQIGKIIADKLLNHRGVMVILRGLWIEEAVYGIRELGMNRNERGKVWASVRYEKQSHFCFACGKLGHLWKNCNKDVEMCSDNPHRQRFGVHMRAGLIRKEVSENGRNAGDEGQKWKEEDDGYGGLEVMEEGHGKERGERRN
ncbi:hypothetical protein CRYUN_Cryun21dG0091700 [Craigia yunnanensis]